MPARKGGEVVHSAEDGGPVEVIMEDVAVGHLPDLILVSLQNSPRYCIYFKSIVKQ
jgi:hypothetical protein